MRSYLRKDHAGSGGEGIVSNGGVCGVGGGGGMDLFHANYNCKVNKHLTFCA